MKWFKHFTDAHDQNDLTKVRMKYGANGYAIYWYCLELIAGDLGYDDTITFELKHDAEVIGFNLQIDRIKVEEIMTFMVKLGLFEKVDHAITCLKLANCLDKKTTRNVNIHRVIDSAERVDPCPRQTETSTDKSGRFPLEVEVEVERPKELGQKNNFDLFWSVYPRKVKKREALDIWKRKKLGSQYQALITDVQNRLQKDDAWKNGFIPHPTTYLRGERWTDEIQITTREPEMKSRSQVLRVGAQKNIKPKVGESMEAYEARVRMTRE